MSKMKHLCILKVTLQEKLKICTAIINKPREECSKDLKKTTKIS